MCLCTSTTCVSVSINDKLKMNKFITQQRLDSKRIGSRTNFTVEKRVELKFNRKMKRAVNGFGCVMRLLGRADDSFFIWNIEVHSSLPSFFQLFQMETESSSLPSIALWVVCIISFLLWTVKKLSELKKSRGSGLKKALLKWCQTVPLVCMNINFDIHKHQFVVQLPPWKNNWTLFLASQPFSRTHYIRNQFSCVLNRKCGKPKCVWFN